MSAIQRLEWSGSYLDGTGARMGHDEEDGTRLPACPECGGIRPDRFPRHLKGYATSGHTAKCELSDELNLKK